MVPVWGVPREGKKTLLPCPYGTKRLEVLALAGFLVSDQSPPAHLRARDQGTPFLR
jgi:hypothetical protein